MEEAKAPIEVGSVVALQAGSFENDSVALLGKVLKPINAEVWETMRGACTSHAHGAEFFAYPKFDDDKAVDWLVQHGYIAEIKYTALHLGYFGSCPSWDDA